MDTPSFPYTVDAIVTFLQTEGLQVVRKIYVSVDPPAVCLLGAAALMTLRKQSPEATTHTLLENLDRSIYGTPCASHLAAVIDFIGVDFGLACVIERQFYGYDWDGRGKKQSDAVQAAGRAFVEEAEAKIARASLERGVP